ITLVRSWSVTARSHVLRGVVEENLGARRKCDRAVTLQDLTRVIPRRTLNVSRDQPDLIKSRSTGSLGLHQPLCGLVQRNLGHGVSIVLDGIGTTVALAQPLCLSCD